MRTLCYGGSFNPIHHGHLICAQAVAESAGYDRVLLIPSARPPHKLAQTDLASAQDRLRMCQIGTVGVPGFAVTDLELRRAEPSYTVFSARQLRAEGWGEVCWLIGGDTVGQLPSWHRPDLLMQEVRFVVMVRPGWVVDWETIPEPYRALRQNVVQAPQIEISSTLVRRRVAAGKSIDFLVPAGVAQYIRTNGLYAGKTP